jgi:hypothetical protein
VTGAIEGFEGRTTLDVDAGAYYRLGMSGVRWSTLKPGNPAISGGLTVKLPHSLFLEGHVTKSVARGFA